MTSLVWVRYVGVFTTPPCAKEAFIFNLTTVYRMKSALTDDCSRAVKRMTAKMGRFTRYLGVLFVDLYDYI